MNLIFTLHLNPAHYVLALYLFLGLKDYIFSIPGKLDISKEIKNYFKNNGYDFLEPEEEEDDDWDDW